MAHCQTTSCFRSPCSLENHWVPGIIWAPKFLFNNHQPLFIMLYVTGTIGSKTYDNTAVAPQDFIELFGLPDPAKGTVEFRVKNTVVDSFGQKRFSPITQIPTVLNGVGVTNKGDNVSIELRYAKNRTVAGNGGFNYTPKRLGDFLGQALAFAPADSARFDAYVFYALHPSCGNSPFVNASPLYQLYDAASEAKKRTEQRTLVLELSRGIFSMDEDLLRTRTMGLTYRVPGGHSVNGFGHGLDVSEIRLMAADLLQRDGLAFIQAWKDQSSLLRGMVQLALDKGIIIQETGSANTALFIWSAGGQIKECSRAEDPFTALVSVFANDANLISELEKQLNMSRAATAKLPDQFDLPSVAKIELDSWQKVDNHRLIKLLLAEDKIYFDRSVNSVVIAEKSDAIYEHLTEGDWKDGFATYLKSLTQAHLKKALVSLLTGNDIGSGIPVDGGSANPEGADE